MLFTRVLTPAIPAIRAPAARSASDLILPPGVQIASSPDNRTCCFRGANPSNHLINLDTDPDYGCPTSFPLGLEGYAVRPLRGGTNHNGAWGMHMGFYLEILALRCARAGYQTGSNKIVWRAGPTSAWSAITGSAGVRQRRRDFPRRDGG